jgi:hypothetical protein
MVPGYTIASAGGITRTPNGTCSRLKSHSQTVPALAHICIGPKGRSLFLWHRLGLIHGESDLSHADTEESVLKAMKNAIWHSRGPLEATLPSSDQ